MDKVLAHVHLAFEGVFDPELLTDFFSDDRIFQRHKRDGGLALLPKYLYDSGSRSVTVRKCAVIVQGLLVSCVFCEFLLCTSKNDVNNCSYFLDYLFLSFVTFLHL